MIKQVGRVFAGVRIRSTFVQAVLAHRQTRSWARLRLLPCCFINQIECKQS